MTDLSPAAQAVLDALCMDELNGPQQLMARAHAAAALRAAADQVLPEEPLYGGDQRWQFERDARQERRRKLLSIAAELDGWPYAPYWERMKCPECGSQRTKTVCTKHCQNPPTTVRRRACEGCGHRFWTQQPVEQPISAYAIDWRGKSGSAYVELVLEPLEELT